MKVLIIEDERRAGSRLGKMILTYDANIEILGRLESVGMAIDWFATNESPDLIFMDIQLGDGLCFDIFEECKIVAPVIFTTAYDQFAIKAFKFYSIDYLLKPVSYTELKGAIDKYHFLKSNLAESQVYKEAATVMKNPVKDKFLVRVGDSINTINIDEVCYIASKDKYTYLHKFDHKKYIIDYTLEQLQLMLDERQFYRINRSNIINRESISDIKTYVNSRLNIQLVIPTEATDMIVSRERVQDFKKWLEG